MEYLKPEMFTETGVELYLQADIKQQETLQFQLDNLNSQVDSIKSEYFKELLVYERKKIYNNNLVPDKVVLDQLKKLEKDPTFKNIKAQQDSLKIQIKAIDEKIKKAKNKLVGLFQFHKMDVFNYVSKLNDYFDGKIDFIEVMEYIFDKEFKNKSLYMIIKLQRNYGMLEFLYKKAPKDVQPIISIMIEEHLRIDAEEDKKNMEMYGLTTLMDYMVFMNIQMDEYLEGINNGR